MNVSSTTAATGPTLAAVVVHYFAPDWCSRTVASLLASEGVTVEVTVVNNGGALEELSNAVTLIENRTNRGYSGGANRGLKECLSKLDGADVEPVAPEDTAPVPVYPEYVALCSHDAVLDPRALSRLLGVANESPKFGILAPWFVPRVARVGSLGRVGTSEGKLEEFRWVSGSMMILRVEMLREIGLLDEDFGSYVEDKEFCLRARSRGWRVGAVRDAMASHHGTASPERAQRMMTGNEILLLAKRLRYKTAIVEVLHLLRRSIPYSSSLSADAPRGSYGLATTLFTMTQLFRFFIRKLAGKSGVGFLQ